MIFYDFSYNIQNSLKNIKGPIKSVFRAILLLQASCRALPKMLPSKKKQCSCCLFFFLLFIIIITMVYIKKCFKMLYCWIHKICRTFEMHQYLFICIIYWKTNSSTISCNTNSSAQPVWTWKIALQNKNRAIKRGLERKNRTVKKSQQICDEKCAMCE